MWSSLYIWGKFHSKSCKYSLSSYKIENMNHFPLTKNGKIYNNFSIVYFYQSTVFRLWFQAAFLLLYTVLEWTSVPTVYVQKRKKNSCCDISGVLDIARELSRSREKKSLENVQYKYWSNGKNYKGKAGYTRQYKMTKLQYKNHKTYNEKNNFKKKQIKMDKWEPKIYGRVIFCLNNTVTSLFNKG